MTPSIIQNTASAWSNYTSDVRKTHCTKHPPGPGGACRAFAFITGAAATPRRFSRQRNSWILGSAAAVSLALRGDQSRSAIAPIFGHTVSSTAKAHGVAQVLGLRSTTAAAAITHRAERAGTCYPRRPQSPPTSRLRVADSTQRYLERRRRHHGDGLHKRWMRALTASKSRARRRLFSSG